MKINLSKIKPFFCSKMGFICDDVDTTLDEQKKIWIFKTPIDTYIIFDFIVEEPEKSTINELRQEYDEYDFYFIFKDYLQYRKYKNFIDKISNSSIFILYDLNNKLSMEYDISYNFLDIPQKSSIKNEVSGIVVNVSLFELLKLYNCIGDALFDKNIRYGQKNTKLQEYFRYYILNDLLNEDDIPSDTIEQIKKTYTEVNHFNNINYYSKYFWFKHNGITILLDDCVCRDNKISFALKNTYIVNGAQTIYNMFDAKYSIMKKLSKLEVEKYIDKVLKNIFVKTIIISTKNVLLSNEITRALNTQISINSYDILNNSEEVNAINNKFKGEIKILKYGEKFSDYNKSIRIMDFIKLYFNISNKPGTSKNYNFKDAGKDIIIINDRLSDTKTIETFIKKIKKNLDVYTWWSKNKEKLSNYKEIGKYGKNYFAAYYSNFTEKDIDTAFNDFVKEIKNYIEKNGETITFLTFKSDDLYNKVFKKRTN